MFIQNLQMRRSSLDTVQFGRFCDLAETFPILGCVVGGPAGSRYLSVKGKTNCTMPRHVLVYFTLEWSCLFLLPPCLFCVSTDISRSGPPRSLAPVPRTRALSRKTISSCFKHTYFMLGIGWGARRQVGNPSFSSSPGWHLFIW